MDTRVAILSMMWIASGTYGQSAIVRVTHNDADGIVTPGQTVQILTTISWQVSQGNSGLYAVGGDVRASPNIGVASNNVLPYGLVPGPNLIAAPGTPSLGSVEGVHLEYSTILGWFLFGGLAPPPWGFYEGLDIVRFDWTAPATPGVVEFDWLPSVALPQPLIASLALNPPVQSVPTTYLGTSLTVIPAPASALALVLGVCGVGAARRRR